jgi:hypothetical protein
VSLVIVVAAVGFLVGSSWAKRKEVGTKDAATGIAFLLVGALAVGNLLVVGVKQRNYWDTATVKIAQFEACDRAVVDAIAARDGANEARNTAIIEFLADPAKKADLLRILATPLPPIPQCG